MARYLAALCAAAAMALATSCNHNQAANQPQTTTGHDTDVQALKDNEAQWNKDFQAKDANRLASHYTEDAVLITPGGPPANGKAAISSSLRQMVSDDALSLQFSPTIVEVAQSGDVAYTQGAYTLTVTDPATKKPVTDHGSYVTVYKKQPDGSWKAYLDIASSGSAPMTPPAKT